MDVLEQVEADHGVEASAPDRQPLFEVRGEECGIGRRQTATRSQRHAQGVEARVHPRDAATTARRRCRYRYRSLTATR